MSDKYFLLLQKIQTSANEIYWQINSEKATDETKELILAFYKKYLETNNLEIAGFDTKTLAGKIYNDTHGFSVLTDPLEDDDVEGIHINAWDTVIVQYRNGTFKHIDGFENPQHAVDIMRRLIQEKGAVLDEAVPVVETSIQSNIRISTVKTPIVDEAIGIACYIRKLSKTVFSVEKYIETGFAMKSEINMLTTMMRRGTSVLVVGRVNSGKTTFLSYLLSTLPNNSKIITIENAAREMDLTKRENGKVINNVIHMLTRQSKNADQNIQQEDLVILSLRLNPEYLSIAEMRDAEAAVVVEASRSGHPVASTVHAGSAVEAHKRIADLARKKNNIDYQSALLQAQEAFPVVVFLHMLEDNTRRIMNITECYVDEKNQAIYNPLWKYDIHDTYVDANDKPIIVGEHKKTGNCSEYLIEKMKLYGISKQEIESLKE